MTSPHQKKNPAEKRLLALDALRGFDMLWIVGLGLFISSFAQVIDYRWAQALHAQLSHAPWHGFRAWDLIFPLFMFLAGASIPYAIRGKLEKGTPKKKLIWRILRRTVLLIFLGIVYNGALNDFSDPRYASVLGQIGLGYCIAAMIVLFTGKFKHVLFAFIIVSVIVTVSQLLIPVPGYGANVLTPEGSINAYLDQLLLPGKLYAIYYDPEGVLCIVSGIGITLIGVLTGLLLRRDKLNGYQKTGFMAGTGILLVVTALLIHPWYPINKEIWTTPFNLLTGGISLILLAAFYLFADVLQLTRWSFPFRVIGMNAIAIYMAARIINFQDISLFLFGGMASLCGVWEVAVIDLGVILIQWLLLFFLYKKKIFLKV